MKTKIDKNFNEFLDEASKPQWLRNDLGKMRKRGRMILIMILSVTDQEYGIY